MLVPVLCLVVILGASEDARAQADPQGYLFNSGQSIQPVFEGWAHNPDGSFWISMNGADQASARIHTTIAVPGATTESTGLPDNPRQGGAWIMGAGTTTAHIMTPGH